MPEDLSVTGYGNDTSGGGIDLERTTIDQRPHEIGAAAAAAALAPEATPGRIQVPGDLLAGESSGPAPGG